MSTKNAAPEALRHLADLLNQARRLYPSSPYLQAEWLHAVGTVRATSAGWILDRPVIPKTERPRP